MAIAWSRISSKVIASPSYADAACRRRCGHWHGHSGACIPQIVDIGRVGRIQFICAADPSDLWAALDCVTDREGVVARDAETVRDASISKSLENIVTHL